MTELLLKSIKNLDGKIGVYILYFDNEKYIGSSMNLRRRLKGYFHNFYKDKHHNKHVLEAYLKVKKVMYDILWILKDKITYEELLKKEEELIFQLKPELNIVKYPTKRHRPNRSKTIHQYDSLGNYMRSYTSITEARKLVGMSESTLTRHLSGKFKRSNKYYWSYEKMDHFSSIENSKQKLYRILKYDLNDNLIKIYNSCIEAAKEHKSNKKLENVSLQISSCCRNKVQKVNENKYKFID